jgi:6-pyruvoyltetrahydropterin/6-carboxytetrahydropterin synthase
MIELTQEFGFDAAHYMPHRVEGDPYRRMHGHSFIAAVTLKGEVDAVTGWVRDFGEIKAALDELRSTLDHRLLNEVPGLENPTLENLARFIFAAVKSQFPGVVRVRVSRPSYGQSCVYEPR